MKKFFATIFILLVNILPIYAASVYQAGGYYGLKDDSGKVVLNAQYQAIEQLTYQPSKKIIIPMHAMDETGLKKLNCYRIKKNNLWGIATSSGKIYQECKYKKIDVDSNGDVVFTLTDGTRKYAHPVINTTKAVRDTAVTVIGLPVTIIGAVMLPIEAISKAKIVE